ncbi:LemA family protein [Vibrio sp. CAIM 722]|uniref:LemA family protein n=1 Tax=Vibrio eleionomae TaxID=2653505 RepID=A0A7X4LLQ4_9VIBR|nr:LemA family protein [Vibrio eleionomae]MZI94288.1 LemA family protein [Vibrio eleionomae]
MSVVFIIIAVVLVLFIFGTYNSLIRKKNAANNAESSIDVMLKKRFDLIPNLVSSVKSYLKHENETLVRLTELRTQGMRANLTQGEKVAIDKQLNQEMSNLRVSLEAYPDLKASENFIMLQRSLNDVEEQISAARRSFNAAVNELNNAVEMIPTNLFAKYMGITTRELFDIPEVEKVNPNVGELFKN